MVDKRLGLLILLFLVSSISCLYIVSGSWFRFNLAEFYEKRNEQDKAMSIYERVLRKAEVNTNNSLLFKKRVSLPQRSYLADKVAYFALKNGYMNKAAGYYKILKEAYPEKIKSYLMYYPLLNDSEKLVDLVLNSKDEYLKSTLPPEYLKSPSWRYFYAKGLFNKGRLTEAEEEFSILSREFPYISTFHQYRDSVLKGALLTKDSAGGSFDFIGIWDFDEGRGDIVKDSSGRFNHGHLAGAKWVNGISGNAVYFNGSGSTFFVLNNPNFNLDGRDFTIAMWVKPARQNKYRFVYFKSRVNLQLGKDDATWTFRLQVPNNMGRRELAVNEPIENKWYFVVQRVKQMQEHKVWIFSAGKPPKTAQTDEIINYGDSNQSPFVLSFMGEGDVNKPDPNENAYFKGSVDELFVFSRALTDSEIQSLYEYYQP